jgi:pimeloyl-ACP methyl ester carboxylesterase
LVGLDTRRWSGSCYRDFKKNLLTKKKSIVLLHGLGAKAAHLQKTGQQLQAVLPRDIEIVSLTEPETASQSITQQAARLKEALLAKGIDRDSYELILLGHSQGGLRGYQFYQEFGEQFDIKGLITMGTPWEGVPTATITKEKVNAYLNSSAAYYFLGTVEYFWPSSRKLILEFVDKFFDKFSTHEPGVQDLVPNSILLQQVATILKDSQLPILAIAGSGDDLKKILLTGTAYADYIRVLPSFILNPIYSVLITGRIGERHDMAISVASQLAYNIPKNEHFSTYTVLDAIHASPPDISISADKVLYNHPEVLSKIVEFTKSLWEL